MLESYQLEIAHLFGDQRVHTNHYIEAEDRQMVKYWFHHHYKSFGHTARWATNEHTIELRGGHVVEIEWINRLDSVQMIDAADRLLPHFPKE